MMVYVQLYFVFLQIGILSFGGGYATLPLIEKFIVKEYHWIDLNTMLDVVSISQMTPGPIAINSATFVGTKIAGIFGSIVATAGVITPQIVILTIFLRFIGTKNKYMVKMLDGINSSIVALIFIATISLIKSVVIVSFSPLILAIFLLSFVLYIKGISLIKLIMGGAIIGVLGLFI
ncbi:chromate transporter [Caviibacter abscessus]|uniref:chromate transporter n=1 Tax=Caviibacter abscessus TaxID=1766719 RepID=UPI0008392286|nr:chromate transporter [Caviibacter abscessus]